MAWPAKVPVMAGDGLAQEARVMASGLPVGWVLVREEFRQEERARVLAVLVEKAPRRVTAVARQVGDP
jgi:hypothetical protein